MKNRREKDERPARAGVNIVQNRKKKKKERKKERKKKVTDLEESYWWKISCSFPFFFPPFPLSSPSFLHLLVPDSPLNLPLSSPFFLTFFCEKKKKKKEKKASQEQSVLSGAIDETQQPTNFYRYSINIRPVATAMSHTTSASVGWRTDLLLLPLPWSP